MELRDRVDTTILNKIARFGIRAEVFLRVDIDPILARKESPTTSHFFNLDSIELISSEESKKFRDILSSILSI